MIIKKYRKEVLHRLSHLKYKGHNNKDIIVLYRVELAFKQAEQRFRSKGKLGCHAFS
jgi:hypothetical protein